MHARAYPGICTRFGSEAQHVGGEAYAMCAGTKSFACARRLVHLQQLQYQQKQGFSTQHH